MIKFFVKSAVNITPPANRKIAINSIDKLNEIGILTSITQIEKEKKLTNFIVLFVNFWRNKSMTYISKNRTSHIVHNNKHFVMVSGLTKNIPSDLPIYLLSPIAKVIFTLNIKMEDNCKILLQKKNSEFQILLIESNGKKVYINNRKNTVEFFLPNLKNLEDYIIININSYIPFGCEPKISCSYGPRRIGKKRSFHSGIDLINSNNRFGIIMTPFEGTIIKSLYSCDYGNHIIIDHGNNVHTLYAHLNKSYVKKGDKVKMGDIIGQIGTTGYSFGAHLHFEIRLNSKRLNPIKGLILLKKNTSKKNHSLKIIKNYTDLIFSKFKI